MDNLEAIYARHSVRNYTGVALDDAEARQLQQVIDTVSAASGLNIQLLRNNPQTFELVARFGAIRGCKDCIAFVAHKRDQDEAIGYWGQLIVLEAQKMGLNTCWARMFAQRKCQADCPPNAAVRIVIAVGHGVNSGSVRESKSATDVVTIASGATKPAWFDTAVEAALLAPTAMNRQAFSIALERDGEVCITAPGKGLTTIDLGIVRRNFDEAKTACANGSSPSNIDRVKRDGSFRVTLGKETQLGNGGA